MLRQHGVHTVGWRGDAIIVIGLGTCILAELLGCTFKVRGLYGAGWGSSFMGGLLLRPGFDQST